MDVSVLIATYKGEKKIPNLLHALTLQTFKKFEVIMVIDGSEDGTYETAMRYENQFERLKIINKKTNNGRPYCLNLAFKEAQGKYILFFDDDMLPEQNCILQHYEFHKKNTAPSILVGNGYRNPEAVKTNFGKFLIESEKYWKSVHSKDFSITLANFAITTCNLSMPKEIFLQLNGFDDRLYDLEDLDIGIRALDKKIPIYYKQSLLAWHNDFPFLKTYIHRLDQYHRAKIKLLSVHPRYQQLLPKKFDMREKTFLKKILLFPFQAGFLLGIDRLFERLALLPDNIKFFIYTLIIAAHSRKNG